MIYSRLLFQELLPDLVEHVMVFRAGEVTQYTKAHSVLCPLGNSPWQAEELVLGVPAVDLSKDSGTNHAIWDIVTLLLVEVVILRMVRTVF